MGVQNPPYPLEKGESHFRIIKTDLLQFVPQNPDTLNHLKNSVNLRAFLCVSQCN